MFKFTPQKAKIMNLVAAMTFFLALLLNGLANLIWWLWEPFVILATWAAGKLVSLRTSRKS